MISPVDNTFLYFAYGSNLLKRRIHINNPSAIFLGVGKLNDHQLDFMKYSDHWRGTSATIVPIKGCHIWGAIWRLHNNDLPALDKQEGVETNWYYPKKVIIHMPSGCSIECRTYQQTINPPVRADLPFEDRPSITYLDCIINGALECKLPEIYIEQLKKIPHNGQKASPKMIEKLKQAAIYTFQVMIKSEIKKSQTIFYFSYGSNLCTFKLQLHNIEAEFVSIGRLDNHRLDFIKYSKFWGGPTATVVPTANAHVWGVIWTVHIDYINTLDKQEGVDIKRYYVKYVEILTPYLGSFKCRTYIQKVNPLTRGDKNIVPVECYPSCSYRKVIIWGAIEHKLPEYYIESLKKLKHNGEKGYFKMENLLKCYAKNEPCKCNFPEQITHKRILNLKKIRHQK